MTKHEANSTLCRALGVEPTRPPDWCGWCKCSLKMHDHGGPCGVHGCTCESFVQRVTYPDLTSADALMAALDCVKLRYHLSHASANIWALDCDTHPVTLPPNFPVMLPESSGDWRGVSAMHGESGGSMLFRAACAVFGIECEP